MADDQGTQSLLLAATSDRCVACGTPMSADQRYCVSCGERRGQARFSLPAGGEPSETVTETAVLAAASPPRSPRASQGTTIVAGVGTLLLAMGVGVLIGRNSADTTTRTQQAAAPVVTVLGGAGTGTAAASAGGAAKKSSSKPSTSKTRTTTHKKSADQPTAAQAEKASDAASKVLGSGNSNLPPATVTVGQTGHGPGYNQSGHFDGSFFGQ
jgi:hypothetical protein